MPNTTLNHLHATAPISTLCFSAAVTNASVYLNGPGGQAGSGFPMLRGGYLHGLSVWDGTTLHTDQTDVPFAAGDKISLYCQNTGSSFTVRVRINGSSASLLVTGVPYNCSLFATLELALFNR